MEPLAGHFETGDVLMLGKDDEIVYVVGVLHGRTDYFTTDYQLMRATGEIMVMSSVMLEELEKQKMLKLLIKK
tara:strand:+ start:70 stop:288 length:219 start_codon:yes stop_codon:yes gene_type:complete